MDVTPTADEPLTPEVFAFDLIGTLFSLATLEPLAIAAGGDASTPRRWFNQVVADGAALTAAREYQPFRDVAKASLREVLPGSKAAARDKVLAGLAKLEPFPDSAPAMGRVDHVGARVRHQQHQLRQHEEAAGTGRAGGVRRLGRLRRGRQGMEAGVRSLRVRGRHPGRRPSSAWPSSAPTPGTSWAGGSPASSPAGATATAPRSPPPSASRDITGKNLLEVVEKLLVLRGT